MYFQKADAQQSLLSPATPRKREGNTLPSFIFYHHFLFTIDSFQILVSSIFPQFLSSLLSIAIEILKIVRNLSMIVSRKIARKFNEVSASAQTLGNHYIRPTKMTKFESSSNPKTDEKKADNAPCKHRERYSEHRNQHHQEDKQAYSDDSTSTSCTSTQHEYECKALIDESIVKLHLEELDPNANSNLQMSPDIYLQNLFEAIMGFHPIVRPTLEVSSQCCCSESDQPFIPPVSDDDQANYCADVVAAVRENDLDSLQKIHSKDGRSLSCCNRFGESLLHMACRRGFEAIVLYLIQDADVSVRITDDCGRTPLHDGLWHKECQYVIMDLLVRTDPLLLLTCDKRGHTPFAYCRREHWANWRKFLWDRREHMKSVMDEEEMELFRPLS